MESMQSPLQPGQVYSNQEAHSTTGQPQGASTREDAAMHTVRQESGVLPGNTETPSHVQGSADHKDMGSPGRANEQQPTDKTLKSMVKGALGALKEGLDKFASTSKKAITDLARDFKNEIKDGTFLENRKAQMQGLADKASLKTGIGLDSKIDQKRSEAAHLLNELKALKDNKEKHVGHYTADLAQVREKIKETAARIKDPATDPVDREVLERAEKALKEKEGKLEAAISAYDGKIQDAESQLKYAQKEWVGLLSAKSDSIKGQASFAGKNIKKSAENLMGRVRTLDLKGGATQLAGKIGKAVTAKFAQLKGTFQTLARNVESRVRGNADKGSHAHYEVPITPQDHGASHLGQLPPIQGEASHIGPLPVSTPQGGASHLGQLPPPPKKAEDAEDEGKEVQAEEHETGSAQGQVGGATDFDTPQVSGTSTPTTIKVPTNEDEGEEVDTEETNVDTPQGQVSSAQTSTSSRVQDDVEEKESAEVETEDVQRGDASQTLQGRVDSKPLSDEAKISTGRKISKAIVKPFKAIKNLATGKADKYQGLETMEQTQEVVLKELAKGKKSALLERELNKAVSSALSEAIEGAGVSEEELKKTGMEGREVYSKLDKALVAADRKLNFLSYSLAGMLLKETDHEARAKMKDSMAATAVKMAREGNYQGAQVIFDALNQTGVRRPVDRGYEQTSEMFEENFKELSDIFARGQAGDLDNHNRLHGSVPYTRLVLHIKKYSDMTKQSFDIASDASTVKAHGSTVEKTLAAFSSWSGFVGGFGEEARDSNLSSEGGIFNSSSMLGEFQNAGERLQDMADVVAPRQPRKQST